MARMPLSSDGLCVFGGREKAERLRWFRKDFDFLVLNISEIGNYL